MRNKYSIQEINEDHSAKARVNAAAVSTKHCIEICNYIRKKNLQKAKDLLKLTIEKKKPIPFKRFFHDVGHRKGDLTSGRYPIKACTEILNVLDSAEANAQFKGLNTSNLIISHISANKASTPWRYGRQIRRKAKRTNVEVVVEEATSKKKVEGKKIGKKEKVSLSKKKLTEDESRTKVKTPSSLPVDKSHEPSSGLQKSQILERTETEVKK